MEIRPRSAWGAVPPTRRVTLPPSQCRYAAIHYSAMAGTNAAAIRAIQRFHMGPDRGWCDIAYNFVVLQDGSVWEGRGWDVAGGHTVGFNSTATAICALLAVKEKPTVAMKKSIREWRDYANKRYGRQLTTRCHQDFPGNATDCPGELTAWVRAGLPCEWPVDADPFAGWPILRRGSCGTCVVTWQKCLNALNANPKLATDGDFGSLTEQATRRFQDFCHIAADGIAGPDTYRGARFFLTLAGFDFSTL